MKRTLLAWCLASLVSGCATSLVPAPPVEPTPGGVPRPEHHTLYVDRQGYLLHPESEERVADLQTAEAGTQAPSQPACPAAKDKTGSELGEARERCYVQHLIQRFRALRATSPSLQLTLHVHGGLNEFKTAAGRSKQFAPHMLGDGHFPVFIGWPSGPLTNYADHLYRVSRGLDRYPLERWFSIPFVFAEDLTRSVIRMPLAIGRELRDGIEVSRSVDGSDEVGAQQRSPQLRAAGFNVVSEAPFTGIGGSYWSAVNPAKLITSPLIDGLGSGAWDGMLRRTDLVLSKTSVFEGKLPRAVDTGSASEEKRDSPYRESFANTATSMLLESWMSDPGLKNVPVNLVGHSMGAIVALNILARYPYLRVDNLVFMAAAARIKDVENVVVPWMQMDEHRETKFYNLSLDPYNEIAERNYWDFIPRGSLLTWIDNFLGEVNSFRDRTAGSWWNITRTARDVFPPRIRSRITLKRFAIGDREGPQQHGDFNDYCFWKASFWAVPDKPKPGEPAGTPPFIQKVRGSWGTPGKSCAGTPLQPLADTERPVH